MFRLYKCSSVNDCEMGDFETIAQARSKMKSLITKEVKTTKYLSEEVCEDGSLKYEYGMWNRYYKIKEIEK